MTSRGLAQLNLLGPLRLTDAEGIDRTPRGSVRRALLAILALSPDGVKSRTKLQDLLWSGSDQQRGSQSLRTALCVLKQELAPLQGAVLRADEQNVRLDLGRIRVDLFEYLEQDGQGRLRAACAGEPPEILEGLNLRPAGDEVFEDWLREARAHWCGRLETALEAPVVQLPVRAAATRGGQDDENRPGAASRGQTGQARILGGGLSQRCAGVGLLNPIIHGTPTCAGFFADTMLDQIMAGLRELCLVQIYDYRDGHPPTPAPSEANGPCLLVQTKISQIGDATGVTLALYRTADQVLIWSWPVSFTPDEAGLPDIGAVHRFINQAVDRLNRTLRDVAEGAGHPDEGTPFAAITTMFRLDDNALWDAQAMIDRAHEETSDPVYLALGAYLRSFRVGEHAQIYAPEIVEETEALLTRFAAENSFNSVGLCLAGHAAGYVLHDLALGRGLMQRAMEVNPNLAICWDHLALHHFYSGDFDAAASAVGKALHCSAFSPLRFTFETTDCMVATLRGDYAAAVERGRGVLRQRPTYGPALRYAAASLSLGGRMEEACELVGRIRAMDADFSADRMAEYRLYVADGARERLCLALSRAGA